MRCAIGILAGITLAIAVVGCAQSDSDSEWNDWTSQSSPGDDAVADDDGSDFDDADDADDAADWEPAPTPVKPPTKSRDVPETKSTAEAQPRVEQESKPFVPRTQLRAGRLTAGSIDDHTGYDDFRRYLSSTLQRNAGRSFPAMNFGRRAVIRVLDTQGDGVGDARVSVRPAPSNDQQARNTSGEYTTTTGSDGRALFLSSRDLSSACSEFLLTVQPAGDAKPVTQRVSLDQPHWNVLLPGSLRRLPTRLDLALVIDTTGSMKDELEYLKVEIDDIAAAVKRRFPNVEQRFALILYRDEGDKYVTRTFDFTGSLTEFRRKLSEQSATGGGDYPEAMHLALEQAGQLSWHKSVAARVLFLVGDAPPHIRFAGRTTAAVEALRSANVRVFPVASSGVRDEAEWMMRSAAFLTLGRYLFLTDHSGVGNPHAKPQTPSYSVERLNALMIRMIASELSGRKLLPREIIATEANTETSVPHIDPSVARHRHAFATPMLPLPSAQGTSVGEPSRSWIDGLDRLTILRVFVALLALVVFWKIDTWPRREAA